MKYDVICTYVRTYEAADLDGAHAKFVRSLDVHPLPRTIDGFSVEVRPADGVFTTADGDLGTDTSAD